MSETEQPHPWRDEDVLRELFVEERLTQEETADRLGCSGPCINKWLHRHEIERGGPPWRDEDTLRRLYIYEDMTMSAIASQFDCRHETVSKWLDEYGIKKPWRDAKTLRHLYCEMDLTMAEVARRLGCSVGTVRSNLREHGFTSPRPDRDPVWRDGDLLHELYIEQEKTTYEIGDILGCGNACVQTWLRRNNISVRDSPTGEDHHFWIHGEGESHQYGPNWEQQRGKAFERDGHACHRCGLSRGAHRDRYGRDMDVHHIRPFIEFTSDDSEPDYEAANDVDNLVPLCIPCHRLLEGIPIDIRPLEGRE